MEKILTADFSNGASQIRLRGIWQHDYGAKLKVKGIDYSTLIRVDFAGANDPKAYPVVAVQETDGTFTAKIPKEVTDQAYDINAYIYVSGNESGYTVKQVVMPVQERVEADPASGGGTATDPYAAVIEKMTEYKKSAENSAKAAAAEVEKVTGKSEQIEQNKDDVASLKGDLDNLTIYRKSENLFSSANAELGCFYNLNNEKTVSDALYESDYISCEYGVYSINPSYVQEVLLFDENKNFVGFHSVTDGSLLITENVKFFRYYGLVSNIKTDMVVRVSEIGSSIKTKDYPTSYVPFGYIIPTEMQTPFYKKWFNKTCLQLGDSITWYDGNKQNNVTVKGYASYLRESGLPVWNKGVSGACIANISTNEDICQTVLNISNFDSYDLITIAGGINDYAFWNTPLGDFAESNFDTTNFTQAYQFIIDRILSRNKHAKLILFTPLKELTKTDANEQGLYLKDYADRIKEIGEYYSIPVLDLYSLSRFNEYNI